MRSATAKRDPFQNASGGRGKKQSWSTNWIVSEHFCNQKYVHRLPSSWKDSTREEKAWFSFHNTAQWKPNNLWSTKWTYSAGYIKDLWTLCGPGGPHRSAAAPPLVALTGRLRRRPCKNQTGHILTIIQICFSAFSFMEKSFYVYLILSVFHFSPLCLVSAPSVFISRCFYSAFAFADSFIVLPSFCLILLFAFFFFPPHHFNFVPKKLKLLDVPSLFLENYTLTQAQITQVSSVITSHQLMPGSLSTTSGVLESLVFTPHEWVATGAGHARRDICPGGIWDGPDVVWRGADAPATVPPSLLPRDASG